MLPTFALPFLAAAAQQSGTGTPQPTPQDTIRVNARLVVLDVIVTDKSGHFVTGLGRDDFQVTENKIVQKIRDFDAPEGHAMPPGSQGKMLVQSNTDLPKIGNAPVNVLVFDEVNTPFHDLAYARQMMERYLKRQPEILPVPTLFIAAGDTHLAVLHDYTQSRAELLQSVHQHTTEVDFSSLVSSLNGGRGGSQNGMVRTLGALAQIASSVRGVPGRKNVIWVGKGYGNSDDARFLSTSDEPKVEAAIRTVTDRMLASHVTLYVIDPEGVTNHLARFPDMDVSGGDEADLAGGSEHGPGGSFDNFAYSTGGRVLLGRNDVEAEIGEAIQEGVQYYTLSYRPEAGSEGGREYRRIHVTMKDPSLQVVTRNGYFAGASTVAAVASNTAKRQPSQIRFDLVNAARTLLVYNGLHVEVKPSANGFNVLVHANDLQWNGAEDGSRTAELTVLAVAFDAKDRELGQHAAELKESLAPTDRIQPESKVGLSFPFSLPPKTARVRFVLRDAATGNLGSANFNP